MLRKVFRTGNSIVVSIPKDILDELKLSEGRNVSVEPDSKQRQIVIYPVQKPKKYHPALQALARWSSS